MPDGDIFSRLGRLAAPVAEALHRALEGAAWDPFFVHRFLERLLAGGVHSLPGVVKELKALADISLFAVVPELREVVVQKVELLTRGSPTSQLDLILRSSVQRLLLQGEYHPVTVLRKFLLDVCDGAVINPRGGLVDQMGHDSRRPALQLLESSIAEAAEKLVRRPDMKRLSLPKPTVDFETNLLVELL